MNTQDTMNTTSAGSFNDEGWFTGRHRLGFTTDLCNNELVSNSRDAKASNILFTRHNDKIYFIDDGEGMNKQVLVDLFDNGKLRAREMNQIGLCGGGGLTSLYLQTMLSGVDTEDKELVCRIFTKTPSKVVEEKDTFEMYTAIAPWSKMTKDKKYSNQISIYPTNEDEKELFNTVRIDDIPWKNQGTVIEFPYSDKLWKSLENQFESPNSISIFQKLAVVHGRSNTDIYINKGDILQKLNKFNPLSLADNAYNSKIVRIPIHVYKSNTYANELVYVANYKDKSWYIHRTNDRYKKEPKTFIDGNEYTELDDYEMELTAYQLVSTERFDINNPPQKLPNSSKFWSPLIKKHFDMTDGDNRQTKQENVEFLESLTIIRNGQPLGSKNIWNRNSARASAKTCNETTYTRCELTYKIQTTEENKNKEHPIDSEMKIQLNKNQLHKEHDNKRLKRLIDYLHKEVAEDIYKWMTNKIKMHTIKESVKTVIDITEDSRRDVEHKLNEANKLLLEINKIPEWSGDNIIRSPKIKMEELINELEQTILGLVDDEESEEEEQSEEEEVHSEEEEVQSEEEEEQYEEEEVQFGEEEVQSGEDEVQSGEEVGQPEPVHVSGEDGPLVRSLFRPSDDSDFKNMDNNELDTIYKTKWDDIDRDQKIQMLELLRSEGFI
jgi:hypothetical protein